MSVLVGKKWRESDTIKFVGLYEKADCLWNFRHPAYKNRNARDKAIQHIIEQMNLPDFGANELKNKIKNIRSTYQQEVNKIKRSKAGFGGGYILEEYKTNLAWFPIADRFLSTVINSSRNSASNQETYLDRVGNIRDAPLSHPSLKDDAIPRRFTNQSSKGSTPENLLRMDPEQGTGAIMKIEVDEDETTIFQNNQSGLFSLVETEMTGDMDQQLDQKFSPSYVTIEHIKEEPIKEEYNSIAPSYTKKRRLSQPHFFDAGDLRTDEFDFQTSTENNHGDEWYHFGNNVACQLRNMPLERALVSQKRIMEILTGERIEALRMDKEEQKKADPGD